MQQDTRISLQQHINWWVHRQSGSSFSSYSLCVGEYVKKVATYQSCRHQTSLRWIETTANSQPACGSVRELFFFFFGYIHTNISYIAIVCVIVSVYVFLFDIATSLCSLWHICCGCKLVRVQPEWVAVNAQVAPPALCCTYNTHTHTPTQLFTVKLSRRSRLTYFSFFFIGCEIFAVNFLVFIFYTVIIPALFP